MGRRSLVEKADIALAAIAQAQGANGVAVADNFLSTSNPTAFTAQASVNYAAAPITLTTGKRFNVSGSISGTASAADLVATVTLQRDGVNIANSALLTVCAGHITFDLAASLSVIDTPSASAHTYSINLIMSSGTITVPPGQANITVSERN